MIYMFHNYFYDMREKKEKIIMSKISGSEIVIECLKEQGVDTVFGYPGGTILNVYDALYKHQDEINHVLTSHEQGAAHAADGYARATGKVGVCMATSGPGATNLVTGIATAYMDSIPVVAITANVGVNMLGKDSFQEIDIAGVVMPITKHSFIVKHIDDLAPTIRRAFKIAKSGRYDAVICLGAVIRGSTSHYDYVCNEVSKGIAAVSLESGVPVLFGVLTTENIEQAIERAGTKAGNKGYDCAVSAIEMVNLLHELDAE